MISFIRKIDAGRLLQSLPIFAILIVSAVLIGVESMDRGRNQLHTHDDLIDALAAVNEQIDRLSTSIDNGDFEGMFSPAGTTVQLLIDRRRELIRKINEH